MRGRASDLARLLKYCGRTREPAGGDSKNCIGGCDAGLMNISVTASHCTDTLVRAGSLGIKKKLAIISDVG